MKILINGVGGPTPRSIARTLKFHSPELGSVSLIGTDINPLAYGMYEKELYDETYIIPPAGKAGYWEALSQIVKHHQIELAMVQPELEVIAWSKRKSENQPLPCPAFLPDHDVNALLVDKSLMTKVLANTGLVPESVNINPSQLDWTELESRLPYPFWIRSTSGSSGLGALKVESREGLENWLNINPGVKHFIASTFLPGRNLACKLLYHRGKLLRAACGERVHYVMSKTAPSGITGNTSFGRLLNDPDLINQSKRAVETIYRSVGKKPNGFFTADFKEDMEGRPFITEINVRMVAFNLSFAVAGANFTSDIVQIMTNNSGFDYNYKEYRFEPGTIFLRDVDAEPILMNESDLKQGFQHLAG